ncbi:MAG TPA: YaeQ family protein [Rhodocyclaceae bacterium]|nr:YaeQ family protein [Rhodocyclaceae bacterium]
MALKATIYKAGLQIADLDRNYYQDHALTLARHPSETDERMMVRLLAFALNASDAMEFGRGISTEDEPALWQKDLTGAIECWIEVGQPDERALRKACGRADRVIVYAYGRGVDVWWSQNAKAFSKLDKLTVFMLQPSECAALAALAERTMQLQCTVQEGQTLWVCDGGTVQVEPRLMSA